MSEQLTNSVWLLTGGTGSLGKALSRYILDNYQPKKLIIFSRDEFKQSEMAKDFPDDNIRFFIGDVRDKERLQQALTGVDYCIHAAALKQVPTLEYNPEEAIKTNVTGSMNVIAGCIRENVKRCVLVSTDKAVSPVNLYGATKLCAEKLFLAANAYNKTKFSFVRYGNVIGSRGSVIPFFQSLKAKGVTKIPITDLEMTRFWITLDEAVDLVMTALESSKDIVIPKAPAMSMTAVARAIVPDCEFEIIGIRPGEKIHESLGDDYTSDKAYQLTEEEFLEKVKKNGHFQTAMSGHGKLG